MNHTFLEKTELFRGAFRDEIEGMLDCLGAEQKFFPKGSTIFHAGDMIKSMGLVLSGRIQIEIDDMWGHKSILDSVEPGLVFAETYAGIPNEPLIVNAIAVENSEILFLNMERILRTCPDACPHHSRLIRNLLTIFSRKNLNLSRRIFHTSSKTIRGRLLSYLSFEARRCQSSEFTISYNRQQLADYLGTDRSALSAELGKMRREGLLETHKNYFILYTPCQDPSGFASVLCPPKQT